MTKVKFTMHDGREVIAEMENYDAMKIVEMLNNRENGEYVAFGNIGFAKHTVKYFEPYVENTL